MISHAFWSHRPHRGVTWLLFALQLLTGGLVSGAHAQERTDAPARFEGTRHDRCPVVHDPSACVLCSYSHAQAVVAAPPALSAAPFPIRSDAPPA